MWWLGLMTAAAAPICLEGATVYLPDGPKQVNVVIEGEKILSIGGGPAHCEPVHVEGKFITAGLIEPHSQLGLVEVGLESETSEFDAGGADPVRAAFRVVDTYNPLSTLIPVARRDGVTAALTLPAGGDVSGQAAAVRLVGHTQAEAVLDPAAAMVVNLGARGDGSRAAALQDLRELLDDARLYGRSRAAYEQGASRDYAAERLDLEALQPVLSGEMPLIVHVDRAADIEALLRLAEEEQLEIIIAGGAEAWIHAETLAAREIPVILDPLVYGPGSFDQLYARPDGPALLAAAGVPVMFSTFSAHNPRKLRQLAGNAVRGGMDHDAALAAITSTPAEVFGLQGRGALAAGAQADLVVWSGDPLELTSWAEQVWVGGERQRLESRQTALLERYRAAPTAPKE